jgi:hypothetical protein
MLSNFKKYFPLAALACGVLALAMCILPTFSLWGYNYTGLNAMFGGGGEGDDLKFSILNILVYLVPLAGGALAFLGAKNGNRKFQFAAIGCFVVALIMFFVAKNFVQFTEVWECDTQAEMRTYIKYQVGTFLSAFFCLAGAGAVAADIYVQ